MSHHLWRYFLEDDIDNFKRILSNAKSKPGSSKTSANTRGSIVGSPGGNKALSTSPVQARKSSGTPGGRAKVTQQNAWTKADINLKDHQGLTLLHWIAASRIDNAWEYAQALLEQPMLDLGIQDAESAWTALHRALYFGNVTIARSIMSTDSWDLRPQTLTTGPLFKIKDREGNSPFDLFNASIAARVLDLDDEEANVSGEADEQDDGSVSEAGLGGKPIVSRGGADGDELFVFGSNKNLNLGVGDEDDRHFPERVILRRPQHLLQRLRLEHISKSLSRKNRSEGNDEMSESLDLSGDPPAIVDFKPIRIKDIQLSKLHTAILTDDPEANLYTCGFGPGGRLGTGDESTRFSFTCVYGGGLQGQKVQSIGLGQDHTLAITDVGEVLSWGSNRFGQLGYSVAANKDEDPVQLTPRQIFGTLKRERVLGCAASRIHSVVYTTNNLYTFGKNEGQLGLVDSDARSLEIQITPRAVAASLFQHAVVQVTAIDKATACLLENTDVYVFANYGYTRVRFPMDDFTNYFLRSTYSTTRYGSDGPNHIIKIGSGGDAICALASGGQVFTLNVSQSIEPVGKASTTNPVKIKNALSEPQRAWSPRKDSMACTDVDVGQDGSIIIATNSGAVWRRTKRPKAKDAALVSSVGAKAKDYKFSRIPGLTCIAGVRSNAFGSFAAIRNDWNVMRTQILDPKKTIWQDCFQLFPFKDLCPMPETGRLEIDADRGVDIEASQIRRAVLEDKDLEATLEAKILTLAHDAHDLKLASTSTDLQIPIHEFLISGRSNVMRNGLCLLRDDHIFSIPDVLMVEYDESGKPLIIFRGLDVLTLFNLALYLYTDNIVDVWHYTRYSPEMTMRYKQVRVELMKTASALNMKELERAARLQIKPKSTLARDLEQAYMAPNFFEHADIEIELKDTSYHGHRALMVQRCPFFHGMFAGLSGGGWVRSRYDDIASEPEDLLKVDLSHVEPAIFDIILRHVYADTGPELFDDLAADNLDELLDMIMEVMAVANELMLDRLSQICQLVLGKFVTTRNVCQLLNAVAPCSVTAFKAAALEYICLNLEIMLENHLLDELDDDLMLELDEVVRENQNANFCLTRRGEAAEEALLERHPDLAERLELSRRRKIDSMKLRARRLQREEEDRVLRDPKSPRMLPKSPRLIAKNSAHDLLFDMDEDGTRSPVSRPIFEMEERTSRPDKVHSPLGSPLDESPWLNAKGKPVALTTADVTASPILGSLNEVTTPTRAVPPRTPTDHLSITPRSSGAPWGAAPMVSERLDMRQILAQADDKRHSSISAGLTAQAGSARPSPTSFKVSQKERRKQMQEQQQRQGGITVQKRTEVSDGKGRPSAWQTVSSGSRVSLKDVLEQSRDAPVPSVGRTPMPAEAQPAATPDDPNTPLRQTGPAKTDKPPASKGKAPSKEQVTIPRRSVSSPVVTRSLPPLTGSSTKVTTQPRPPSPKPKPSSKQQPPPLSMSSTVTPRSVRHNPVSTEPSLQLSMADILAQQQLEKEVIKEATAKRSLQEIQQEQEFMEWWEAEEKATKARLEAGERAASAANNTQRGGKAGRGRGKGRPRDTRRDRGDGDKNKSGSEVAAATTTATTAAAAATAAAAVPADGRKENRSSTMRASRGRRRGGAAQV